jgi:hypothetical protein
MLHTIKRGLFVGSAVVVVAALCSGSALAARGHTKFAPRAAHGMMGGGFGPFFMGGPGFGMRGFGGPGFGGPGFGPFGKFGPGGGLLATDVLKQAATYLGVSLSDLQADLKGGKTLAQEATAKGKTAAGLITALTNGAKENLSAAVAAGWITQAQADAVLERTTEEITALVNNGPPVPPEKRAGPLDAAATYLGMTVADLRTALAGGKTLAQVAADKGKTVDGLVSALTADVKKKIDAAVAANTITQAQANAILSKVTEHVTDFVKGVHGPKAAATTTNAIKHALRYAVRR